MIVSDIFEDSVQFGERAYFGSPAFMFEILCFVFCYRPNQN